MKWQNIGDGNHTMCVAGVNDVLLAFFLLLFENVNTLNNEESVSYSHLGISLKKKNQFSAWIFQMS